MDVSETRDLKVDRHRSNLHVMLKQLLFLYKFYFFCRRQSLMNRPCYNLVQAMQHDDFRNLNRLLLIENI